MRRFDLVRSVGILVGIAMIIAILAGVRSTDRVAAQSPSVTLADPTTYTCAPSGGSGVIDGTLALSTFRETDAVQVWLSRPERAGYGNRISEVFRWYPPFGSVAYTGSLPFQLTFPERVSGAIVTAVLIEFYTESSGLTGQRTVLLSRCGVTPTPTLRPNPVPTLTPTPRPTATPTPIPTVVPTTKYVTKVDGTNCRATPKLGAKILKFLPAGTEISTRGASANGWTPIRCGGTVSYVMTSALGNAMPTLGTSFIVKSDGTNCRVSPRTSASAITLLLPGLEVTRRGASVDGWTPVSCGGTVGYAMTSALGDSPPPIGVAFVVKWDGTNCRTSPSTSAKVVTYLPVTTQVTRRGSSVNGWTPVTCGGTLGYVMTSALGSSVTTNYGTTYVAKTDGTNCRQQPSMSATVLKWVAFGEMVSIRGVEANGWTPIRCGGTVSYVMTSALSGGQVTTISQTPKRGGTYCRTGRSFSAGEIALLAEGEHVTVVGTSINGWNAVICRGVGGFVASTYLTGFAITAASAPTPTVTPTVTPTATPTVTPSPTSTATATITPSPSPTATSTATIVPSPTLSPSPTPTYAEVVDSPNATPIAPDTGD